MSHADVCKMIGFIKHLGLSSLCVVSVTKMYLIGIFLKFKGLLLKLSNCNCTVFGRNCIPTVQLMKVF